MKQRNKFLLSIVMDLSKIHDAYVRNDTFSAGFELGALLNRVVNSVNQDEREEDDEEVQEEECDEECEESSEEEISFLEFQREKTARILAEDGLAAANGKIKKLEETNETIKETKRAIFELQDILMRLLKFKKIASEEVTNVINILRNCGVSKGDIDVICKGQIK
jgi:hypothetical protein